MPVDVEQLLERVLAEVRGTNDHDRLEQRFAAIEQRLQSGNGGNGEQTIATLARALNELDDDELDRLAADVEAGLEPPAPPAGDGEPDDDEPDDETPRPRTRRGRKSGSVYDWDVDESGAVVKLDMGRVYSGPDEPDEVELPAEPDDETEDDDE